MVMDSSQNSPHSSNQTEENYEHVVGREFVRQYYTLLNQSPNHLHRFYAEQSSFVHGAIDPVYEGRDENRENAKDTGIVYGQKEIHQRIMQLNFQDCKTKIRQVDSHATLGNGVVVQVSGELSNAGQPMRRFMQTFVLEPQGMKKFYVRNDIFRYQDEVFGMIDNCNSIANLENEVQMSAPYASYHIITDSSHQLPRQHLENGKPNTGSGYYGELNVGQNGYGNHYVDKQTYEMLQSSTFPESSVANATNNVPTMIHERVMAPNLSEAHNMGAYGNMAMVESAQPDSSTYVSEPVAQDHLANGHQRSSSEKLPLIGEGWIKNNHESSEAEPEQTNENAYESEYKGEKYESNIADSSTCVSEVESHDDIVPATNKRKSSESVSVSNLKMKTNHDSDVDEELAKSKDGTDLAEESKGLSLVPEPSEPKTYANLLKSGVSTSQAHILNVSSGNGLPPAGFSKYGQRRAVSPKNVSSSHSSNIQKSGQSNPQQDINISPDADGQRVSSSFSQTQDFERSQGNSRPTQRSGISNRGASNSYRGGTNRQTAPNSTGFRDRFHPDSQQLFVGNLPSDCTEGELQFLFEKFGKVAEVRIIQKPGQPKFTTQGTRVPPFGFVVFEDESGVAQCLNNIPVLMDDGHRLNVEQKKYRNSGGEFNNYQGRSSFGRGSNGTYQTQNSKSSSSAGYVSSNRNTQSPGLNNGNSERQNVDNDDGHDEGFMTPRSARGKGRAGGSRKI